MLVDNNHHYKAFINWYNKQNEELKDQLGSIVGVLELKLSGDIDPKQQISILFSLIRNINFFLEYSEDETREAKKELKNLLIFSVQKKLDEILMPKNLLDNKGEIDIELIKDLFENNKKLFRKDAYLLQMINSAILPNYEIILSGDAGNEFILRNKKKKKGRDKIALMSPERTPKRMSFNGLFSWMKPEVTMSDSRSEIPEAPALPDVEENKPPLVQMNPLLAALQNFDKTKLAKTTEENTESPRTRFKKEKIQVSSGAAITSIEQLGKSRRQLNKAATKKRRGMQTEQNMPQSELQAAMQKVSARNKVKKQAVIREYPIMQIIGEAAKSGLTWQQVAEALNEGENYFLPKIDTEKGVPFIDFVPSSNPATDFENSSDMEIDKKLSEKKSEMFAALQPELFGTRQVVTGGNATPTGAPRTRRERPISPLSFQKTIEKTTPRTQRLAAKLAKSRITALPISPIDMVQENRNILDRAIYPKLEVVTEEIGLDQSGIIELNNTPQKGPKR